MNKPLIVLGLAALGLWTIAPAAAQTAEPPKTPPAVSPTKPDPAALAKLKTIAEQSAFLSTARYDEVQTFLKDLAAASPLVRLTDIGVSGEGRKIPMALLADPPVATAEEAKRSGKLIIAMLGGIHSGECDGKEALLALARDIASQRHAAKRAKEGADQKVDQTPGPTPAPLNAIDLDHAVLIFIPNYNPDANEKMAPGNRRGQAGPETVGERENAAGLDLNRDFVKLEAPETRGLVRMLNQYDPAVFIDTHTTNGSFHRYALTFDTNKNPAGDAALLAFARETMLPRISKTVKDKHALETFWYGNFEQGHSRWETYPDEPRFGVNYVGMRNRIAILTESYSYAPYKERVDAQYKFVGACIDDAVEHRDELRKLIKDADQRATGSEDGAAERGRTGRGRRGQNRQGGTPPPAEERKEDVNANDETKPAKDESIKVAIRSKLVASEARATLLGFVEEERDGRAHPTKEPRDYEAELHLTFAPETSVVRPHAYVISLSDSTANAGGKFAPAITKVLETLQRHGIKVDELREDIELDLAAYTVESVKPESRPFQGHTLATVDATANPATRRIAAGSLLIKASQPLGTLAAYLLEPTSADGLATWNFFDDSLKVGQEFAVLRVEKATQITTIAAPELPEDAKPKQAITFDLVEGDRAPNLSGSAAGIGAWTDDTHFLQVKNGKQYEVEAATGRSVRFIDPAPIAAALERLPTITKGEADSIANRSNLNWDKSRAAFVFDHKGDLYYCRKDATGACRLTTSPKAEEHWAMSPDGQFVAFVRENDLWVVDVATHTERALTFGGSDTLRRGKPDWVYMEEVLGRGRSSFWWSPDSTRIAFLEIDSSPVKVYTLVNDIPEGLRVEGTRYPKVGQPNPTVKLFSVQVAGGEPREVELLDYSPQDMLILNVGWRADSSGFIAYVSNRFQTWADVLACPADAGSPTKLFRETTKAWVEDSPPPRFLKDGSFLFQSERTGWKHFYHYAKDGKLLKALTAGEWEARSIVELDEEHHRLYISGTRDGGIEDNLYCVTLDSDANPPPIALLTSGKGSHRASVSPKGTYFVDSWSDPEHPTRVAIFKTSDQSLVRTLDTNPVRELDKYILGTYERVQMATKDGFLLEGSILKPADFNPTKRYPVWFMTYAGPHAPTVGSGWSRRASDEYLCNAGFIVFRADPRSASGKGAVSTWTAYKQLGVQELKDVEEAITWLCQHPWIDASRIGMAGHSYGGFMTAYCMTHSKLFAAGVAGAPVTDWRDYDSIYTERYMLTPAENPEGYEKTSVVKAAKNLHGRLLLLHGMIDDNVHPQNSTRFIRALQQAEKPFEVMFYPESRHGIGGKHYNRLVYEFITRTLGNPPEPTPPKPSQSTTERTGP
ncbi:MAG: DPP IV N-terminal domain-containing protein [Planctomycetota bacterium]